MSVRACIDIFDILIYTLGLYNTAQRESIIENTVWCITGTEQNARNADWKQIDPRLKSDFLCSSDSCHRILFVLFACCHTFFVIIWVPGWESRSHAQTHCTWWSACWAIYHAEVLGNTAGQLRDKSRLFFHFCVQSFDIFTVKSICIKIKKSDQTAWNEIPSNSTMSSLSQNLK